MATRRFRPNFFVQFIGKQLKQSPIRHEISFSTAPNVFKDAVVADLPTHTGQVIKLKGFGRLCLVTRLN
jgi:hypothetical protein